MYHLLAWNQALVSACLLFSYICVRLLVHRTLLICFLLWVLAFRCLDTSTVRSCSAPCCSWKVPLFGAWANRRSCNAPVNPIVLLLVIKAVLESHMRETEDIAGTTCE